MYYYRQSFTKSGNVSIYSRFYNIYGNPTDPNTADGPLIIYDNNLNVATTIADVTKESTGIFRTDWTIPSNFPVGTYTYELSGIDLTNLLQSTISIQITDEPSISGLTLTYRSNGYLRYL